MEMRKTKLRLSDSLDRAELLAVPDLQSAARFPALLELLYAVESGGVAIGCQCCRFLTGFVRNWPRELTEIIDRLAFGLNF